MKKRVEFSAICLCSMSILSGFVFGQSASPYNLVWTTPPGDTAFGFSGEGINRVINNKAGLSAGFDSDGDGNLEFLAALQSSNEVPGRDNNLYLFEADGDNNYSLRWSYKVENVQHQRNSVAVGDLDENGRPEIVWVVDRLEQLEDNVMFFEYDPALGNFPDQPTATWNTPRSDADLFRCEVDLKVFDIDQDGRQEIIFISFDGVVIASLSTPDFTFPVFIDEYRNFSELIWTFSTTIADLDNNGTNELVTFGAYGLGGFSIIEATGPDTYNLAVNRSLGEMPDGLGPYNAMTAADLDGNGFPEIYYTDTNGNFRSFATNGPYTTIGPNHFHLLGTVGFEVLNIIAHDQTFYAGTSVASQIFQIDYVGGEITDPLNYQFTQIFADTVSGTAGITIFRIDGAIDLDGDDKQDIVFVAANHDSSRPTLYVIEAQTATAVETRRTDQIPARFSLEQNYPNPFNPSTTITFSLPLNKRISLSIYNMSGQEIKKLIDDEDYNQGTHSVQWNATDDQGNPVASGVYIYRLIYGNFSKTKTMTLVR